MLSSWLAVVNDGYFMIFQYFHHVCTDTWTQDSRIRCMAVYHMCHLRYFSHWSCQTKYPKYVEVCFWILLDSTQEVTDLALALRVASKAQQRAEAEELKQLSEARVALKSKKKPRFPISGVFFFWGSTFVSGIHFGGVCSGLLFILLFFVWVSHVNVARFFNMS